jgi:hypothetical protein
MGPPRIVPIADAPYRARWTMAGHWHRLSDANRALVLECAERENHNMKVERQNRNMKNLRLH